MNDGVRVSRLGPEHASAYRELRLSALQSHPEVYGASVGEEAGLSQSDMTRRLSDGAWFEEYGREPGAIRTGDDYYGEILMRLPLAHR